MSNKVEKEDELLLHSRNFLSTTPVSHSCKQYVLVNENNKTPKEIEKLISKYLKFHIVISIIFFSFFFT